MVWVHGWGVCHGCHLGCMLPGLHASWAACCLGCMEGERGGWSILMWNHHCHPCCVPHSLHPFQPHHLLSSCSLGCDDVWQLNWSWKREASVAYQSQLVMCHLQVIDDGSLILPLLSTPGTEGQTAMMAEGIRGMDILEPRYFRWLQGQYEPKEMDVLGWVSHCLVGSCQIFPSIPGVLSLEGRGV